MREFSLLIKPASWSCNLACRYCFYLKKSELYPGPQPRMSEAVLERMIVDFFATPMPTYTFGWQGGEPTLMGLDFFRRAVELQTRHCPPGSRVANALQTNGTLLTPEWAKFLRQHHFLVGLSIDGPEAIHDRNRRTVDGRGTFGTVDEAIRLLRRSGVEFNALTLVNAANAAKPLDIYRLLTGKGIDFHQYIECVEPGNDYSVGSRAWGEFHNAIFDYWYKNDVGKVSIRLFDSIVNQLVTGFADCCIRSENCCHYLVVEHNGDVYPCDFHVLPELKLGNLAETSLAACFESERFRAFGERKSVLTPECRSCRHLEFCRGCCLKNRDESNQSRLCEGWQLFYDHTIPRFRLLADRVRRGDFNRKK